MQTRYYSRLDVIKHLKDNLDEHAEIVAEARKGYHDRLIELLEQRLEEAKKPGFILRETLWISPPADYSDQIKDAIAMFEMLTDEKIALTDLEFKQFVLGKWDWAEKFLVANSSYSSKAYLANMK